MVQNGERHPLHPLKLQISRSYPYKPLKFASIFLFNRPKYWMDYFRWCTLKNSHNQPELWVRFYGFYFFKGLFYKNVIRLSMCFNVELLLKVEKCDRVFVGGDPVNWVDPLGLASVGDTVFFSWHGTQWPNHATVVSQVDTNGNATHAFGAWGDSMTFHEVDLRQYNGGIQGNIIGYGDMTGINSGSLQDFMNHWNGRNVAPDWDGSKGNVCIDATTAPDGWGGPSLRDAMRQDYNNNPDSYRDFGAGSANPNSDLFFRRNGWLQQFFINTNRYQEP